MARDTIFIFEIILLLVRQGGGNDRHWARRPGQLTVGDPKKWYCWLHLVLCQRETEARPEIRLSNQVPSWSKNIKLKTLQSDMPGRPYDDIVPIVEAELGPLAESFSSFSENGLFTIPLIQFTSL